MFNEFQKQIQKKDIVGFFLMIAFFTCVITMISIYLLKKNKYIFEPDFDIKKVIFRDQIDSQQMLDIVLKAPHIKKNFSPNIGDFIGYKEVGLFVTPRKEILCYFDVYVLNHSTLDEEYVFSSNTITITKDSLISERIKTPSTLNSIKYSWYMFVSDVNTAQIGDYVWKNPEGKYYIMKKDELYLKKHLHDSSLDGMLTINEIKNLLNND